MYNTTAQWKKAAARISVPYPPSGIPSRMKVDAGAVAIKAVIAGAIGAGIVALINYKVWESRSTASQSDRMIWLWVAVLPWIPLVFSSFVASELPCVPGEGRIDPIRLYGTFGNAGSVGALNAVTMFALVEALVVTRRRWELKKAPAFAVSVIGVLIFWVWHMVRIPLPPFS
jgi:hypothetical protein